MKKLFSFLLFIFVIFSANSISFADEVIPFNKSFFAYNEPSFTSAKGNGGAQYGPQKALTVKEKRSDGWWKIGTWEGDKWINTDGEKKKIEKPYITFAEPKFTSPKGNNGNVIAPQVVTAIDGQEDGWLKIQTNEGDKWIFLNSEAVKVDKSFYAYNEPSFTSEKASGGNQYGPQKSLVVKEKRTNGWWKVATYEGDKWVNLDGELKAFDKPFLAFYEPSFSSQKGNMEKPYSSNTTVRVIDGNTKGWLKFQSWEGDKWMYPGVAETVVLDKSFYSYNEPSLIATKGAGGNQFGPQKFLPILEKRPDGWWKVVTYEGPQWIAPDGIKMPVNVNFTTFDEPYLEAGKSSEFGPQKNLVAYDGKKTEQGDFYLVGTYLGQKWMTLNGEKEFNEKRDPMRKELGYNETEIGPDKTPQQRVAEVKAALRAQGLEDEFEVLKIPTEEEKAEFLRKEAEKQNNTPKGARASTVTSSWNIPDNWVQKGDIVVTAGNGYGLVGHVGIIGKDFTETQGFSGANKGEYLLVHAPGKTASPTVQIMPLSKWEFIHKGNQHYSQFLYLRVKNKSSKENAFKAADVAYNYFYKESSKFKYDVFASSAKTNDNNIYSAKLVYLSYLHAGYNIFPTGFFYLLHPYDYISPLTTLHKLTIYFHGEGGKWWG
ncbi:hypothetical protein CN630_19775 [Bacillus wiedmannii]|uniref:hypothetical protein n=1 Tax=Bacillus wiedmannii TaxID=1890302 RepID=UPI000BF2B746|nr:hypothetical protein [Bacillus wiedmannii]PEN45019.1 hypothetical protein CN630_19775 [Bacillus wiedmannii]